MTILRKTTALLPAIALALAGIAAPAPLRASSGDDLARFLAGAAVIAIIAKGLHDREKRKAQAAEPPRHDRGRGHGRGHGHAQPQTLPQHCAVQYRIRGGGSQTFYLADCMARSGVRLRQLPQHCSHELRTRQGRQTAYQGACLRQAGYRSARM